jgi:GTP-binding protein
MDWQAEYDQLRAEIAAHSVELAAKPHCVVFTKMDLLGELEPPPINAPDATSVVAVSAAARLGLDALLAMWWGQLLEMRKASERVAAASRVELP